MVQNNIKYLLTLLFLTLFSCGTNTQVKMVKVCHCDDYVKIDKYIDRQLSFFPEKDSLTDIEAYTENLIDYRYDVKKDALILFCQRKNVTFEVNGLNNTNYVTHGLDSCEYVEW